MKKLIYGALLAMPLLAPGCAQKGQNDDLVTINLGEKIGTDTIDEFSGKMNVERIIPLEETDSSLLASGWIKGMICDTALVVDDGTSVYLFGNKDGKYLSSFSRSGDGPGEYSYIASLCVTPDNNLFVHDGSKSKIFKYSPDGKCLAEMNSGGRLDDIIPSGDGYLALTSTLDDKELKAVKYDSGMNVVATYPIGTVDYDYKGLIMTYQFMPGETVESKGKCNISENV